MTNKGKLILIILLIFALIYVVEIISSYIKYTSTERHPVSGILPSTYTLLAEDSAIIFKAALGKIKVQEIYRSKERGPISHLVFDNKFRIAIYKIELNSTANMNDLLHVKEKNLDQSLGVDYRVTGLSYFYLLYKGGKSKPISQVYLSIGGDSVSTVVKNDSLASYHLLCENLSFKYSPDEPTDLYFESRIDFEAVEYQKISLDILLLRKTGALYLLIMAPIDNTASIDPKLLYDIVDK